ncbi:hemerythrin domain-containing protein [Actinomadura rubrisoli]|uniref:hemerythrin domain-containing protein n=1 Tax=Actinomadura rubrisoli TaxID=2530368 RepID=UPI001A9EA466|nr:hemerythrin domain-containing protein [Actinomadura rubrisoli]
MSVTTGPGERSRVDMTMMYAVHDAFQRDLDRLTAMAEGGVASGPAVQAGWDRFKRFLHVHHTAEDTHLWPVLRAKAGDPAVLDQMEDEHTRLTALLDAVDAAVASGVPERLALHAGRLAEALGAHCEHEEDLALPLVGELLTEAEWNAFGAEQRKRLGSGGAASFFPWLLDGAEDGTRRKVLGVVPPPVRFLYRAVWRPRYQRAPRWQAPAA